MSSTGWTTSPVGGTQLLDTAGGGWVDVANVFLQFAGFTFGKSASAYATPWNGFPGKNTSFLLGGNDSICAEKHCGNARTFTAQTFRRRVLTNIFKPLLALRLAAAHPLSVADRREAVMASVLSS
jgi:hypothetical protein